jgi:GNAT superfamily N-acetyltransferase
MELIERLPSATEYVGLREAVGWSSPGVEQCERALHGSVASVCAVEGGEVVAMGRLVGDAAMNCFAVDVVVAPAHQGKGVGAAIMSQLEAIAVREALAERVDLVAAPDVVPFYRRLGYAPVPSELMRKAL